MVGVGCYGEGGQESSSAVGRERKVRRDWARFYGVRDREGSREWKGRREGRLLEDYVDIINMVAWRWELIFRQPRKAGIKFKSVSVSTGCCITARYSVGRLEKLARAYSKFAGEPGLKRKLLNIK